MISVRAAGPQDASSIAWLHADSWRRHYRGAYADSFLDGDVEADRRAVWAERLAAEEKAEEKTATLMAQDEAGITGFVHVVFDADDTWGSLVDNLHVRHDRQRAGIGRALMAGAARVVEERAQTAAMFLWVLEQNTRAQAFYQATGGRRTGRKPVPAPGGVPGRLNGSPYCLRYAWRLIPAG